MIIITQPTVTDAQIDHIVARIEEFGLRSQVMRGETRVVIGVIGPDELVREKPLGAIPGVESVVPVMKPYKLVAQENGSLPPPVSIGDVKIGSGQRVVLISGPCSVESKERLLAIANAVKKAGARVLRGGAFKPRTSPYSFQGLGEDGLRYLAQARADTGLPIITEIMDTRDLERVEQYADCLQIGSRNMQNFALLKEVGRSRLPVMLKRGFSATINDLLMSAEYILSEGNPQRPPLRARHPHLRNDDAQHARSQCGPDLKSEDALAGRGRSDPRHWPARLRSANVARRGRSRGGRVDD